jgi:hypothetical protein
MGFEPKIPVFEQLKTEHSTGVVAAVIDLNFFLGVVCLSGAVLSP